MREDRPNLAYLGITFGGAIDDREAGRAREARRAGIKNNLSGFRRKREREVEKSRSMERERERVQATVFSGAVPIRGQQRRGRRGFRFGSCSPDRLNNHGIISRGHVGSDAWAPVLRVPTEPLPR